VYIALSVVTGGLVALMILVNGRLQSVAGALPALIFIHLTGLVASALYLALTGSSARRERSASAPAFSEGRVASPVPAVSSASQIAVTPFWFVFAGALGIGVVFLNNLIFIKGGVLLALGGTLAGQTLFAHLLEGTRWFDGRRSPTVQRVLSLALVLPGAALIGLRSGVGIGWTALSWLPGALLMIQSMMNARNAVRWGQSRMLLFNYATALLALLPLFALLGLAGSNFSPGGRAVGSWSALARTAGDTAPYLLVVGGAIGVIVVGTSIFLFNRSSALKVVLGLYSGQIAVGILIDSLSGLPLQIEKLVGIGMVVIGLGAGEIRRMRRPRRRTQEPVIGRNAER